jgi:DNA helicase-2/ATP-dependent DNA helicase PcrA
LDCRDLLEIALEASPDSFLIPAHVWTPWFSVLGSKSGFDSVQECFGDLTSHIFALETGLSSDPEMNYRVSSLDAFTLISNSDTHSPSKLGREANIFVGTPGYVPIREGIRVGGAAFRLKFGEFHERGPVELLNDWPALPDGLIGTVEFFPEEGKYHLDGHRKCATRLDPSETEALGGKCPICGRPVTVGVMNRVIELADREPGRVPERAGLFWRMLPLIEIVAQALDLGPQSKKVEAVYLDLLKKLGPELIVLWSLPIEEIDGHAPAVVTEAVRRVRKGEVFIEAGFDGEYGKVELFGPGEREYFTGQDSFLSVTGPRRRKTQGRPPRAKKTRKEMAPADCRSHAGEPTLNEEQHLAVRILNQAVLVQAGPGTGKTRTLTHRIAGLIQSGRAQPEGITAVTFTRKAAQEMRERLELLASPELAQRCWVGTFHQLGGRILEYLRNDDPSLIRDKILDYDNALNLFREAVKGAHLDIHPPSAPRLFAQVSLLKQNLVDPQATSGDVTTAKAYAMYENLLHRVGAYDLDDLLIKPVKFLAGSHSDARTVAAKWAEHLLVDEFQDVNRAQYEMVKLLSRPDGKGLFAIGDPNQAIYGFRGAERELFFRFQQDFSDSECVRLRRNYRSQPTILEAAQQVLNGPDRAQLLIPQCQESVPIKVVTVPNASLEAKFVVRTIDSIMGGSSFFSLDSRTVSLKDQKLGFRDFAVLFRLNAVGDVLEEEFKASGIPFQRARRAKPEDEAEEFDRRVEAVSLMTIHASKGLEFPVVFIIGCEEGILPYTPEHEEDTRTIDLDEERRLLYVAMTRARSDLFLTRSLRRGLFGRNQENLPSRFLTQIDPSLCDFTDPLGKRKPHRGSSPRQCELFAFS